MNEKLSISVLFQLQPKTETNNIDHINSLLKRKHHKNCSSAVSIFAFAEQMRWLGYLLYCWQAQFLLFVLGLERRLHSVLIEELEDMWCVNEDSARADDGDSHVDEEQEAVHQQGDVAPVIDYLQQQVTYQSSSVSLRINCWHNTISAFQRHSGCYTVPKKLIRRYLSWQCGCTCVSPYVRQGMYGYVPQTNGWT